CIALAAALGLLLGHWCQRPSPKPPVVGNGLPAPLAELRGTVYCEQARRLALYWENGDFELWDTEQGTRLGEVVRLARPAAWCVASPDETSLLTGDRMVKATGSSDLELVEGKFIPSLDVWDTKSGTRKHSIRVPEALGHRLYLHEWYARW